jgi:hypothetical protein
MGTTRVVLKRRTETYRIPATSVTIKCAAFHLRFHLVLFITTSSTTYMEDYCTALDGKLPCWSLSSPFVHPASNTTTRGRHSPQLFGWWILGAGNETLLRRAKPKLSTRSVCHLIVGISFYEVAWHQSMPSNTPLMNTRSSYARIPGRARLR